MTRLTLAAACAALTTLVALPAFAGEPVTAKLASPLASPVKFIAGGAIFNCEADACTASATTSETYSNATCKTIAGKFGGVAAFTSTKSFDDARLGACNASVVAKAAGPQLATK